MVQMMLLCSLKQLLELELPENKERQLFNLQILGFHNSNTYVDFYFIMEESSIEKMQNLSSITSTKISCIPSRK
jgi:hypothetical protein